jgi:hypothetical protein
MKSKRTSFCFPGLVPKYKALLDLERQPTEAETIRNLQAETYMLARQAARNPESRNTDLIQSHQQTIQALREIEDENERRRAGLVSYVTQSGPFVPVNVVSQFGLHQRTMTRGDYRQRMAQIQQELVPEPEDRNAFPSRGTVGNGDDSEDSEEFFEPEEERPPLTQRVAEAVRGVASAAGPPIMRGLGGLAEGVGGAVSTGLPPLARGVGTGLGMAATGIGYGVAHVGAATGRLVAQSIYDAVTDIAPHALEGPEPLLAIEGPVESQMFQSPVVGPALRRSNRSTRGVPHQRSDFEYE